MNKELKKIICVIPVYNDWESFSMLVSAIAKTYCMPQKKIEIHIVAINDGSFEEIENNSSATEIPIEIINLNSISPVKSFNSSLHCSSKIFFKHIKS